jgi:hypothetical protein
MQVSEYFGRIARPMVECADLADGALAIGQLEQSQRARVDRKTALRYPQRLQTLQCFDRYIVFVQYREHVCSVSHPRFPLDQDLYF